MNENQYIPIIDLSAFNNNNDDDDDANENAKIAVAMELRKACHSVGFFYIMNHGFDENLLSETFEAAKQFFRSDDDVKKSAQMADTADANADAIRRGYIIDCEGFRESFWIGAQGGDGRLRADNIFPVGLRSEWRKLVERFYCEMLACARRVARALALSLHQKEDFFTKNMTDPLSTMLLLKYRQSIRDKDVRRDACKPHTDFGFITLLCQESGVAGLQVKNRNANDDDDDWVPAPHIDKTILVNIGDLLSRWSNNYYVSTIHRVEQNYTDRPRFSIPFFCDCNDETIVEPIVDSSDQQPPLYEPVVAGQYIQDRYING
jgi:isopenicillin N synthase-like dioxygenase